MTYIVRTSVLQSVAVFVILLLTAADVRAQNPRVEVKTTAGNFTIELYADQAPKTVANFLQYANSGFYNGTIFHRVIDGFMVQGGGFDSGMRQKTTRAPIENEAGAALKGGLRNETGSVAMARTPNPHSASAQFFISRVRARGRRNGYGASNIQSTDDDFRAF